MRERWKKLIGGVLCVALLAGCGGNSAGNDAPPSPTSQPADAVTEAAADGNGDSGNVNEENNEENNEADDAVTEQNDESSGEGEDSGFGIISEGDTLTLNGLTFLRGGMIEAAEYEEPEEGSDEDKDRMDRAMREYVPSEDSLLVNNAKSFYFYEQMSKEQQDIYDCIMMLADDPMNTSNIVVLKRDAKSGSQQFKKDLNIGLFGALYDHPELFWLYNALKTDINMKQFTSGEVYFSLAEPYKDYEKDMKAFNKAAEDFLKDIDLDQSEDKIARDIHDKLIDMVTYDFEVAEKNLNDLAHTAYGALVANGRGEKNTAVCDGYSLAYLYLLQQAGLEATVLLGVGGESKLTAGPHAWNSVKLGDDWYDVDTTWDDLGNVEEELKDPRIDSKSRSYIQEAVTDPDYRELRQHYMYNLTTAMMKNYKMDRKYDYVTKDKKYTINLAFDCVHLKASELTDEDYDKWLMKLTTEAKGTKFR